MAVVMVMLVVVMEVVVVMLVVMKLLSRLHMYGTYEQGEEEEGEVYEVLNIRSLKQATPNLRVINLWGVRCSSHGCPGQLYVVRTMTIFELVVFRTYCKIIALF